MIDFTWKVFSQTGNIETYLLLKELEDEPNAREFDSTMSSEVSPFDSKM